MRDEINHDRLNAELDAEAARLREERTYVPIRPVSPPMKRPPDPRKTAFDADIRSIVLRAIEQVVAKKAMGLIR